jgi:hypothetical protein
LDPTCRSPIVFFPASLWQIACLCLMTVVFALKQRRQLIFVGYILLEEIPVYCIILNL